MCLSFLLCGFVIVVILEISTIVCYLLYKMATREIDYTTNKDE